MATQVAGELYASITGQLFEIGRQLRQPNGYPYDPVALKSVLQDIIEGRFNSPSRYPHFNPVAFIGKGWSIAEDREAISEKWDPTQTILVSSLRKGETSITGEKTFARLAGDKSLGGRAFLYFWNHQNEIPEEWRGKLIFFGATILRGPSGNRYSLYLYWGGDGWYWDCSWLGSGRSANCVSACAS